MTDFYDDGIAYADVQNINKLKANINSNSNINANGVQNKNKLSVKDIHNFNRLVAKDIGYLKNQIKLVKKKEVLNKIQKLVINKCEFEEKNRRISKDNTNV